MVGDPIILVNRIQSDLTFVADGRHYELKPGPNYGFVSGHAQFAMAQNPMFGSENYYTLDYESMVGVQGQTNCDPISDAELLVSLDKPERFDRAASGMPPKVAVKIAKLRGRQASAVSENVFATGR
jgi:hypothetical protein